MIGIRSKLLSAERARTAAVAAADVGMHAVLTLDPQRRLLHANSAGEALLSRGEGLMLRRQRLAAWLAQDQNALQAAVARAGSAEATEASALLVHRPEGAPYELSVASANTDGTRRHIIVVVTERGVRDASLHARIRTLYGLTPAEAEVAVRVAEGASLELISGERQARISTVRTQLKAITAKMGCSRQSQLVAMINSLPRFRRTR
jgi:DNA-binding CsgD family transcriptional regulator